MIIRLVVLGWEVFCLTVGAEEGEPAEEDGPLIGGGSSHNFERDPSPLSPDDRYDWGDWEFGFGRPKRGKGGDDDATD